MSIVQDIQRKSTDFLRRVIVPIESQGGVTLSYVCPHCHCLPLEDEIWWVTSGHGKKQCNWCCAACGGQHNWKAPNRTLVIQDGTDRQCAKVFRAHAAPQDVRDNLINALKLLANQQVVQGLRTMDGLKKFIMVDDHEAVKDGELDTNVESR